MIRTPQTITEVLAAGATKKVPISLPGRYFSLLTCTAASCELSFDGHDFQTVYAGVGYPTSEAITTIWLRDSLGAGCTIVATITDADIPIQDSRTSAAATLLAQVVALLTTIDADTSDLAAILAELQGIAVAGTQVADVTPAAATATSFLAANAARIGCMVQARHTNAASIYVGFSNAVTNAVKVMELAAGQGYTFDNYRGPLWVYSVAGGDVAFGGEW